MILRLIVADEPTGNLDSKTAETVFGLFNDLVAQGKTVIIVTHDSGLAKRSNRTALIADGEIVNEYVAKALPTLTFDQLLAATHKAEAAQVRSRSHDPHRRHERRCVLHRVQGHRGGHPAASQSVRRGGPGAGTRASTSVRSSSSTSTATGPRFAPARRCAVEVLELSYAELNELLSQSEVTRDALHKAADAHEQENIRGRETGPEMGVIWNKIWFDLWHNKTRTLLTVLSIAVGVFAMGAIFGMSDMMSSEMDRSHRSVVPPHITVFLHRAGGAGRSLRPAGYSGRRGCGAVQRDQHPVQDPPGGRVAAGRHPHARRLRGTRSTSWSSCGRGEWPAGEGRPGRGAHGGAVQQAGDRRLDHLQDRQPGAHGDHHHADPASIRSAAAVLRLLASSS